MSVKCFMSAEGQGIYVDESFFCMYLSSLDGNHAAQEGETQEEREGLAEHDAYMLN